MQVNCNVHAYAMQSVLCNTYFPMLTLFFTPLSYLLVVKISVCMVL